jgi:hypothetical protein
LILACCGRGPMLSRRPKRDSLLPLSWQVRHATPGLTIRTDVATASELRRLAKREPRRRTAQRILANLASPHRVVRCGLRGRHCRGNSARSQGPG